MQTVGRLAVVANLIQGVGQAPRVIVPERAEVVEFKGPAQLWGGQRNGTFCSIYAEQ